MAKSNGDFRRRNPVTREMIERHRNSVHMDKRRRVMEQFMAEHLDDIDPDDYDTSIDAAGNVTVIFTGGKHE